MNMATPFIAVVFVFAALPVERLFWQLRCVRRAHAYWTGAGDTTADDATADDGGRGGLSSINSHAVGQSGGGGGGALSVEHGRARFASSSAAIGRTTEQESLGTVVITRRLSTEDQSRSMATEAEQQAALEDSEVAGGDDSDGASDDEGNSNDTGGLMEPLIRPSEDKISGNKGKGAIGRSGSGRRGHSSAPSLMPARPRSPHHEQQLNGSDFTTKAMLASDDGRDEATGRREGWASFHAGFRRSKALVRKSMPLPSYPSPLYYTNPSF